MNALNSGGVVIVTVADPRRFGRMLDVLRQDHRVLEDSTFPNSQRAFLVLAPTVL
jgi:hypothetical protein